MNTLTRSPAIRLTIIAAVLLLAACSSQRPSPAASRSAAPEAPHLTRPLPPGFSLVTPGAQLLPSVLAVAPVARLNLAALSRGPVPANQVAGVTQAIVNQPVPTQVRPLLVSAAGLRPAQTLTVAAGGLPVFPHDAEFILQGPGFLAQRLVRVVDGVAVVAVTLPHSLTPGTWALAAEDLSGVHAAAGSRPTGTVLLDLAIFDVSA